MNRPTPSVTVIIPVRDDAARLARSIESIRDNQFPGDAVELIVADNGSSDGSDAVAERLGARVLRLPGRRVSALRNEAAGAARGDLLAFVDADHVLAPGWLAAAVAAIAEEGVGAVGAPYDAPPDGTWVQRTYDGLRRHAVEPSPADWLGSGNLLVRRSVFAEVGGFDQALTTCEDVDFCMRLRARGYRIVNDPRLRSIHLGDPASLRALFAGELWRGRDNLRVSLRDSLSLRALPGIAIPVLDLFLLASIVGALTVLKGSGVRVAVAAASGVVLLSAARAAVMCRRMPARGVKGAARALAVALAYDTARALALVVPAGHAVRRRP